MPISGCSGKSADGTARPSIVERVKATVVGDELQGPWHDARPLNASMGPFATVTFERGGRVHGRIGNYLVPVPLNVSGTYQIVRHADGQTHPGRLKFQLRAEGQAVDEIDRIYYIGKTANDRGQLWLFGPQSATTGSRPAQELTR